MLRIGLIGTGSMGSTHAYGWSQTPAQLVGAISLEPEQTRRVCQRYGATIYDDVDALIRDVDVVDICTPTPTHHEFVLKAAAAGKHAVCEKPLGRTLAQGEAMVRACREAGVHLLVGHVVRFFPEFETAKARIDTGDIGAPGVIRLKRSGFQPHRGTSSWFLDFEQSGGLILDLMIHDCDYARWIAGDVESVYAKDVRSSDPGAKGDYAIAILRHTSGAITHLESAWAYPPPMFRTAFEIAGSAGLIEHTSEGSVPLGVYLDQQPGTEAAAIAIPQSPLKVDPWTLEIQHFYEVLTGTIPQPRITAEDALAALRIALAAIQSARTGHAVRIEEVQ
jgi:predicted dehydrogenase